ncbi:uncharacterized protein LOC129943163 [Eupeodes corollae]|uniref:uncharacterized protein LOC129943163 n=1 Tax=Eupeodes corollae TaxID=290404 RepID=UPI00248FE673|nr:uncharacterized protein LOC129943163 [Eupeodes corollae]
MHESYGFADSFRPVVDYFNRYFTCHYKKVNSKRPNDYIKMLQIRRKTSMMKFNFIRSCDISWTEKKVIGILVLLCSINLSISSSSSHSARYSAPLNNTSEDDFKPMALTHYDSELIARQQFTKTGQYRIFEPVESDLRFNRKEFKKQNEINIESDHPIKPEEIKVNVFKKMPQNDKRVEDVLNDMDISSELRSIEESITSFLDELFVKKNIERSGIRVKINDSDETNEIEGLSKIGTKLEKNIERFVRSAVVNVSLPRAAETGRLFFFAGLKKILWPIFIGIQIIKSLIFALFLPSIIGSFGKIASQGSSSLAGFNRPSETVNDLNFKDNFEDDSKFMVMDDGSYAYNQPEASSNHFSTQPHDAAALNNNALSRFGQNDNTKDLYLNTYGYDEKKNAHFNPDSSSLSQIYETFKKLPSSSLVLSNYDPFYSPILSRLDGIFDQLGLKSKDENCREKLICHMYADPEKYAPYSNLVSAQLSRELDELRKPTSENPEILRFFKYMKAAKDGQDGIKCAETYSMCTDFKDLENPAMINTFNDINKLVEARKLTN